MRWLIRKLIAWAYRDASPEHDAAGIDREYLSASDSS